MKKHFIYILIIWVAFPLFSYATVIPGYHINKNIDLVPNDPKGNKKVILITIDDGPSKYGRDMVATLLRHKAPAIFFINGIHDKDNVGNIAFESKLGFYIGNHTWDHANLTKIKKEKVQKEIDDNTKLITKETGKAPKFFRSPFGMGNSYIKNLVKKDGMISMNWSGAAKDWEKSTRDKKVFLKNVMADLHPGEILLIHEHEWTSKYLDELLTTLEAKGYTFLDPNQITE